MAFGLACSFSLTQLVGVGTADAAQTYVSSSYLQALGPDQLVAYIKPYIAPLPFNL